MSASGSFGDLCPFLSSEDLLPYFGEVDVDAVDEDHPENESAFNTFSNNDALVYHASTACETPVSFVAEVFSEQTALPSAAANTGVNEKDQKKKKASVTGKVTVRSGSIAKRRRRSNTKRAAVRISPSVSKCSSTCLTKSASILDEVKEEANRASEEYRKVYTAQRFGQMPGLLTEKGEPELDEDGRKCKKYEERLQLNRISAGVSRYRHQCYKELLEKKLLELKEKVDKLEKKLLSKPQTDLNQMLHILDASNSSSLPTSWAPGVASTLESSFISVPPLNVGIITSPEKPLCAPGNNMAERSDHNSFYGRETFKNTQGLQSTVNQMEGGPVSQENIPTRNINNLWYCDKFRHQ